MNVRQRSADVERGKDAILVQLWAELDSRREAQGLSVRQLAKRSGLSPRGLVHMRKTETNPSLGTIVAITNALGLKLVVRCEESKQCGYDPADSGNT